MPSGSWTCWGSGLAGSALRCIRTRRASSTSARSVMAERRQTARRNRSTSSASPTRGENRGRVRTWRGKQRPKAALLARWSRSRTGAGLTGTGLSASSASGCLRCSMVIMLTTASRGISGGYSSIATKSRGYGTSGWSVEREEGCTYGLTSTRSSPVIRCQRPGSSTATPDGANLSREEPDGGNLRVRICGGRGGQRPRLPGNLAGDAKGKSTSGSNREAESTDAPERGGLPCSSAEAAVMAVERRGQAIGVELGQPVRRDEPIVQRKAAAFMRWHEPDKSRGLSPDL